MRPKRGGSTRGRIDTTARNTQVDHMNAVSSYENVLRSKIAVNDPFGMQSEHRLANVEDHTHGTKRVETTAALHQLLQSRTGTYS